MYVGSWRGIAQQLPKMRVLNCYASEINKILFLPLALVTPVHRPYRRDQAVLADPHCPVNQQVPLHLSHTSEFV